MANWLDNKVPEIAVLLGSNSSRAKGWKYVSNNAQASSLIMALLKEMNTWHCQKRIEVIACDLDSAAVSKAGKP